MSDDSRVPEADDDIPIEEDVPIDDIDGESDALVTTMDSAPDGSSPTTSSVPSVEVEPAAEEPTVVRRVRPSGRPASPKTPPPRVPTSKNPTPANGLPPSNAPRSVPPRPRSAPPAKPPPSARANQASVPPRPKTPPPRTPLPTLTGGSQAPGPPQPSSPPPGPGASQPPSPGAGQALRGHSSHPPRAAVPGSFPPKPASRPPGPGAGLQEAALRTAPTPTFDDEDSVDDEMDRPTLVHNPEAGDPSVEEAIASAREAADRRPSAPPEPAPPPPPVEEGRPPTPDLSMFDEDEVDGIDLAKTIKLEPRSRPKAPPAEDDDGEDKPPEIPSLSSQPPARERKSRPGRRRRSRKGKRRMVKIPDDNVPATPTPPAVADSREPMDSFSDELDRPSDYPDEDRDSELPEALSEPPSAEEEIDPGRRESGPGIFTDDAAIAVLRPIQVVSDLPAMAPDEAEEIEPEPEAPPGPPPARTSSESERKLPPPRSGSTAIEDIEEVEEVEELELDEARPRPPGPPPPRTGSPDASGPQKAVAAEDLAKVPATGESSAADNAALAEARAREAEAKAQAAEARAREAAAKAEAARAAAKPPRKPWWMTMFEDELVRTLDNPKKRDVEKDCDLLQKLMRLEPQARVLDLACGAGVHAAELSDRGFQVVGVDHSQTMLELGKAYNKQRGTSVSFIQGDMRQLSLEGIFDGIFCWGASFGYFDDKQNAQVLEKVARALRPGGVFTLDVPNRDFIAPRAPTMAWFEKPGVVCMDEMRFDFYSSRMITKRMILFDTGKSREIEMSIRLYTLTELGRLFHKVGLKILDVTGHRAHPGAYFGAESPRIIISGKRREDAGD